MTSAASRTWHVHFHRLISSLFETFISSHTHQNTETSSWILKSRYVLCIVIRLSIFSNLSKDNEAKKVSELHCVFHVFPFGNFIYDADCRSSAQIAVEFRISSAIVSKDIFWCTNCRWSSGRQWRRAEKSERRKKNWKCKRLWKKIMLLLLLTRAREH